MFDLVSLVGGFLGFIIGLVLFIATICIWSDVAKIKNSLVALEKLAEGQVRALAEKPKEG